MYGRKTCREFIGFWDPFELHYNISAWEKGGTPSRLEVIRANLKHIRANLKILYHTVILYEKEITQ